MSNGSLASPRSPSKAENVFGGSFLWVHQPMHDLIQDLYSCTRITHLTVVPGSSLSIWKSGESSNVHACLKAGLYFFQAMVNGLHLCNSHFQ